MPRVREFSMDGFSVKIAPLTLVEADNFIKEGQQLLSSNASPEDWLKRTIELVCRSLNKAGNADPWNEGRLRGEMDLALMNALYREILEFSGLTVTKVSKGEETAAPALPASAAA